MAVVTNAASPPLPRRPLLMSRAATMNREDRNARTAESAATMAVSPRKRYPDWFIERAIIRRPEAGTGSLSDPSPASQFCAPAGASRSRQPSSA